MESEIKRFAHGWELVRKVFPEDALSWELLGSRVGVRCIDDKSPFSYGSSLYADLENNVVSVGAVEYLPRAEELIRVLNEDNIWGKFILGEIKKR